MSTYAITGANRGIGLELVKQLAGQSGEKVHKIFALSRGQTSDRLGQLISAQRGRVVHVSCEVTNEESIQIAVKNVQSQTEGKGLDVLINNVGVSPSRNIIGGIP